MFQFEKAMTNVSSVCDNIKGSAIFKLAYAVSRDITYLQKKMTKVYVARLENMFKNYSEL